VEATVENFIRLSLGDDVQATRDLQRWIQAGVPDCEIHEVTAPAQTGQKGLELTNELVIAAIGAPAALLALARTICAYLFARPEIAVELVHKDGRRVVVNAKNVSFDKVAEFATQLSGAVNADAPGSSHA
jgi:hypothetical protein